MCCFTLIPFSSLSSFHIHWLLLLTSCCFLLKKCHWFFTYPFWPSLPSQLGSCSYNQDTDFWFPQHLDTTQSLLSSHLWSQQGIACPALTLLTGSVVILGSCCTVSCSAARYCCGFFLWRASGMGLYVGLISLLPHLPICWCWGFSYALPERLVVNMSSSPHLNELFPEDLKCLGLK